MLQLPEPYFEKRHVIHCHRVFSHRDLAAYLRSRQTGMVGTADITSLEPNLKYLVTNMHPLSWAYKWYRYKANLTHRTRQGEERKLLAEEPLCLLVWIDKKHRTRDKKVVFSLTAYTLFQTIRNFNATERTSRTKTEITLDSL